MASKRQPQQDTSPRHPRGGGQAVVKLCGVSKAGIVFWSRQRFEVTAELQLRVRIEALPPELHDAVRVDHHGWACVRGFVVECAAVRKPDGAATFQVSLVLDAALDAPRLPAQAAAPLRRAAGGLFGLN